MRLEGFYFFENDNALTLKNGALGLFCRPRYSCGALPPPSPHSRLPTAGDHSRPCHHRQEVRQDPALPLPGLRAPHIVLLRADLLLPGGGRGHLRGAQGVCRAPVTETFCPPPITRMRLSVWKGEYELYWNVVVGVNNGMFYPH